MPNMLVILVFLFLCKGLGFMVRRIYKFFSESSIHSKFKLVNHDVAARKKGIFQYKVKHDNSYGVRSVSHSQLLLENKGFKDKKGF